MAGRKTTVAMSSFIAKGMLRSINRGKNIKSVPREGRTIDRVNFIGIKRFEQADSLLAAVAEDYPYGILADNALFKRAEIQETVFLNRDRAMELYQKILTDYPGSLFVTEARKRFRLLRGDHLPEYNDGKNILP